MLEGIICPACEATIEEIEIKESLTCKNCKTDLKDRRFLDFLEFLMANGNEQLIPKINELLKLSKNVKYSENLQNACRFFVSDFNKSYNHRLKEFIENNVNPNS